VIIATELGYTVVERVSGIEFAIDLDNDGLALTEPYYPLVPIMGAVLPGGACPINARPGVQRALNTLTSMKICIDKPAVSTDRSTSRDARLEELRREYVRRRDDG